MTNKMMVVFIFIFINSFAQIGRGPVAVRGKWMSSQEQIQYTIAMLDQAIKNNDLRYLEGVLHNNDIMIDSTSEDSDIQNYSFQITPYKIIERDSTAYIYCTIKDADREISKNERIVLKKINKHWKIFSARKITKIIKRMKLAQQGNSLQKVSSLTSTASLPITNIIDSKRMIIRRNIPRMSTYEFTKLNAEQIFGDQLFQGPVTRDLIQITSINDNMDIVLDRGGSRIVYGRDGEGAGQNWYSSYGDKPGNYRFSYPQAMDVDENGNIYVADTGNRIIVCLYFDVANKIITFRKTLSIPGMRSPMDISIYKNGTFGNTTDDLLFVADMVGGSIFVINKDGVLQRRLDQYKDASGNIYPLNRPFKIQVANSTNYNGPLLAIIDAEENALVTTAINAQGTFPTNYITKFPSQYPLRCIGLDYYNYFWVGSSSRLHGFNSKGQYVATTYSDVHNTPHFFMLGLISSSGNVNESIGHLDVYTSDGWSDQHGLQTFLPGADVAQLTTTDKGNGFQFNWTYTNLCYGKGEVFTDPDQLNLNNKAGFSSGGDEPNWSLIFVDNIIMNTSSYYLKQEYGRVVIHELGHQRGIMTSSIDYNGTSHSKGHNGSNKTFCVMHNPYEYNSYGENEWLQTLENPIFCEGHNQMLFNLNWSNN